MRLVIADFAGHPFPYELSRELTRNGHEVVHSYCSSNVSPHAAFDDPDVPVVAVDLGRTFDRYNTFARIRDEVAYGIRTARVVRNHRAEVLITGNVPVLSLFVLWVTTALLRIRWVLWLQDLQSGLAAIVRGQPGLATKALGALEHFLIRRAAAVVTISPEFERAVLDLGVATQRVTTIENWAPIDKLPMAPRKNQWAQAQQLTDRFVFLYSGTLGKKHSPELLLALADEFSHDTNVSIVIVAQGAGADEITGNARKNMTLLPLQPFEELPRVLGSADVLVALLDPAAGAFSVPSKTLSYLCAGRPILASIPSENAAARLISEHAGAGVVVSNGSADAFRAAARRLYEDDSFRHQAGKAARAYAEQHFEISAIAERFESVLARG